MKRTVALIPLFCLVLNVAYATDWYSRLYPRRQNSVTYKASSIELSRVSFEESSVDDYNRGVELNNEAIGYLHSGDPKSAVPLLKEAVEVSPAAKGFRQNYVIALNNAKAAPATIIKEAQVLLNMDNNDDNTAYLIGLNYLNGFKNYEKAADYFSYALKIKPDNGSYAHALITALENSGKYDETVFNLLKKYAQKIPDSPYPYYLLGNKYLERGYYSEAVTAFGKAKQLDSNGYAHHAYVRAAYYAGRLNGLEELSRKTLNSFPKDKNIESTRRIHNSLAVGDYAFIENVKLKIAGASALKKLNFKIRPIKGYSDHQDVELISAYITSRGKKQELDKTVSEDGAMIVSVPSKLWSPELDVKLKYHIKTKALCGVYFYDGKKPDLSELKQDKNFSLDDNRLNQIMSIVEDYDMGNLGYEPGFDELFALKASTVVSKILGYHENGIDMPVKWALDNPDSCDCTEFSRLLAALCLKKNIPARLVNGYLVKSDSLNKDSSIGHEWCEVYVNGRGWMPVDPTLQSTMHRAYLGNILNDQIFFEYTDDHGHSRIGVDYVATSSSIKVEINNIYRIEKWQ